MSQNWPGISVVIPAYNAAGHLPRLLDSLKSQDYPQTLLDIIVVDDDSEDQTAAVAAQYGARLVRNGRHHIERGKSLGLAAAENEFVLFLDADNYLTDAAWLRTALEPLLADPSLAGAQSIRFHYDPQDPAANRYCSLFGINDPMAYYLGRRDRLTAVETGWKLMGRVEDKGAYYLGAFNLPQVPTLGSQGFLTRASLLRKVNHDPYLFHMEANLELIRQGHNRYVLLKSDIGHDHVTTAAGFIKKCRRNIELFYRFGHLRTYRWETSPWRLLGIVLSMVTLLRPLADAWRGYGRLKDPAWFLHPWFCLAVPLVYAQVTVKWKLKKLAAALRPRPEKA